MLKNALTAGIILIVCSAQLEAADYRDVESILHKYRSIRPQSADLAIYELDWAPTLKAAAEKAAREERPIFLIFVRNSFGNISSGHC